MVSWSVCRVVRRVGQWWCEGRGPRVHWTLADPGHTPGSTHAGTYNSGGGGGRERGKRYRWSMYMHDVIVCWLWNFFTYWACSWWETGSVLTYHCSQVHTLAPSHLHTHTSQGHNRPHTSPPTLTIIGGHFPGHLHIFLGESKFLLGLSNSQSLKSLHHLRRLEGWIQTHNYIEYPHALFLPPSRPTYQ